MHRAPVNAHLTATECLVTGEDLHQRRFAGAVLTYQAVDPAGFEREGHAVQHAYRPERFDDLVEFDGDTHRRPRSFEIIEIPGTLKILFEEDGKDQAKRENRHRTKRTEVRTGCSAEKPLSKDG